MKVTSINSTTSDFVLDICPAYTAGWTFLRIGRAGINVKTADLLAALDATANTDVAGMRRDLIAAENAADEWKARAEKAEAALGRPAELTNNAKASFLWDLAGEVEDQKSPVKRLPKDSETGSVSIGEWLRARALCFPMDGAES